MRYWTGRGDEGKTSILGGHQVWKDDPRIEAIGAVDELNAFLGFVLSISRNAEISRVIKQVQRQLFILGGDLATPLDSGLRIERIRKEHVAWVEDVIEKVGNKLPPIRWFILPGGSQLASILHIARTVCRRAERRIVALSRLKEVNPEVLRYINRLSTLLYILARWANMTEGVEEERA